MSKTEECDRHKCFSGNSKESFVCVINLFGTAQNINKRGTAIALFGLGKDAIAAHFDWSCDQHCPNGVMAPFHPSCSNTKVSFYPIGTQFRGALNDFANSIRCYRKAVKGADTCGLGTIPNSGNNHLSKHGS